MHQLTDTNFLESYTLGQELYSRPDRSVQVRAGQSLAIPNQKVAFKYIAGPSYDDSDESHLWETMPPHYNLPLYFGSSKLTNPADPLRSANVLAFESLYDSQSSSKLFLPNKNVQPIMKVHKKIVFYQILLALNHLHSNNIAHMNITLDNVMIDPANLSTKLIGLSRSVLLQTGKYLKSKNSIHGFSNLSTNESPSNSEDYKRDAATKIDNYTAPENLPSQDFSSKFSSSTGFETDLWNCGIILFTLLTGSFPFSSPSPSTLKSQIKSGAYTLPFSLLSSPSPLITTSDSDLLSLLLCPTPSLRPTVSQALQHRFFDQLYFNYSDNSS